MKKCPLCAESIQNEAIKCRFCGSMLAESGVMRGASPEGAGFMEIAQAALTAGNIQVAIENAEKAIGADPKNAEAWWIKSEALERLAKEYAASRNLDGSQVATARLGRILGLKSCQPEDA